MSATTRTDAATFSPHMMPPEWNLAQPVVQAHVCAAIESELTAYQAALENAALVYGVPFERDQPEKTLAKLTAEIEKRATDAAIKWSANT